MTAIEIDYSDGHCIAPLRDGRRCWAAAEGFVPLCDRHQRAVYENVKMRIEMLREDFRLIERKRDDDRLKQSRARRKTHPPIVYIAVSAELPGFVKIGTTTCLSERMKKLRCIPLVTIAGGRSCEGALHDRFSSYRRFCALGTEWFVWRDDVASFVIEVATKQTERGRSCCPEMQIQVEKPPVRRIESVRSKSPRQSKRVDTLTSVRAGYLRALEKRRAS